MTEGDAPAPGRRRFLRYAAVALAAMSVAYGARVWDEAQNDVRLTYRGAPEGLFIVDIRDDEGARMRRAEFSPTVGRQHTVQLPRGRFEARLRVGEATRRRAFDVEGDGSIEVDWDR